MTTIRVLFFLSFVLTSCGVRLAGNVYAPFSVTTATDAPDGSSIPGLRIDAVRGDTLLIKYKLYEEQFMDADFVYNKKNGYYESTAALLVGSGPVQKQLVYLRIKGSNELLIRYGDFQANKWMEYRRLYTKKVNLNTHRDPYYAEDGFSL